MGYVVRRVFREVNFFLLDGGGLTTRRYANIGIQNDVFAGRGLTLLNIVDFEALKA